MPKPAAPDVQLLVGSNLYSGWKSISVRRSLDQFANTFDLTLTDNQADRGRTIKLGAPCQVRIEGETLITGYIDRIRPGYDGRQRRLTVSGRSKTGDLVDCSIPATESPVQNDNRNLLQLAQQVCAPFGIRATSQVTDLQPIAITTDDSGQTPFELLEKHARSAGVRLITDPDGNLVIVRASDARVGTALVLGENIEAAEGEFNQRDRFSVYHITGQQRGWDESSGESAAHVTSDIKDPAVTRYRPATVVVGENLTPAQAKSRGEWERNLHYGRSRQATYTVSGWRHKDGLWAPNTNVRVQDHWMGFYGEWLMIGTVEFTLDNSGSRTQLTVMPREAYDLVPLPEEHGGTWS